MFPQWTKTQWLALWLGIAVLVAIPQFTDNDGTRMWMDILMFMILAMSWNFIGGLTGYPSFATAAFFGLGAYTTAIAMNHGDRHAVTGEFFRCRQAKPTGAAQDQGPLLTVESDAHGTVAWGEGRRDAAN